MASFRSLVLLLCAFGASQAQFNVSCGTATNTLYNFNIPDINGTNVRFSDYAGQVVLIANVASFCGETISEYTAYNKLWSQFGDQAFKMFGFPCAQFDNQEPGDGQEIPNSLYYVRPGNSFVTKVHLMSKIQVNGAQQHPIYTWLKSACPAPSQNFIPATYLDWEPVYTNDITWNFEKFLIDKKGRPYKRYDSGVDGATLAGDIAMLLAQ